MAHVKYSDCGIPSDLYYINGTWKIMWGGFGVRGMGSRVS